MPDITQIPAPRVEFIDRRTGLMAREWYRFFLNLFALTGGGKNDTTLTDLQLGPPVSPQIDELQKQVDALALQTRPELGTMAALQQNNIPWLQFNTFPEGFPTGAAANGTLYWDNSDGIKTLNLVMEDSGGVIQQIGEETYYRIKADADITNGQVIMFTGTVGASGALKGAPATGLTATQNEYIMGVATQDIAHNGWGYVTWFGLVRGIDTTGGAESWVDGQILYYDPAVAGGLTKNLPTAPNPKVIVASVINAASNGSLFVRPTFGSVFGVTNSDVEITSLSGGDILQYNASTQRWENVPASTSGGAPVTKTADFTVAAGETWLINNKAGSSCTVTLPTASTNTGRVLYFLNYQSQTVVSASSNVVPLIGGAASTSILPAVIGSKATLVSDGTNWITTQ